MYGTAEIHGSNGPNGEICIIPFKNENIAVQLKTNDGDAEPRTLSSVPDLIAVLDARSGRGIGAMFEYRSVSEEPPRSTPHTAREL